MKKSVNECDIKNSELEAEIMASFLLRPGIVRESIYAFSQCRMLCQLFSSLLIKQREAFEEYSFRIEMKGIIEKQIIMDFLT